MPEDDPSMLEDDPLPVRVFFLLFGGLFYLVAFAILLNVFWTYRGVIGTIGLGVGIWGLMSWLGSKGPEPPDNAHSW